MAVQVTVLSIDDEQLSAPKKSIFSKSDISIGRSRLNDLVLEHPGVSNTHARVRIEGINGSTKFYVSDLDSTNGTMVGNKRLDPRAETILTERDRIMIAGFILKIDSVPEEMDVQTSPQSHNVVSSAEPKLAEGKTTNSYVVVDEPKLADSDPKMNETKKEQIPNGTVWNSNLLGAYRDQRPNPKANPMSEPEPILSARPRRKSEVDPISWPTDTDLDLNIPENNVPEFAAETKLVLEDHLTLDFVATKLLSISGIVTRKGQPLAGVVVADANIGTTETDEEGRFSFKDIIEGTQYDLGFEKAGYVLTPNTCSGSLNDEDLSVELTAKRLLTITGAITHKGAGLADVVVDAGKLGVAKTDNMGLYKFENALEGEEYVLKASKAGFTFGTVRKSA